MFVKEYLKLVTSMNHQTNIFDLHDLFLKSEEFLKNDPELVNAENVFEQMIKQVGADAVFSYYPEL